MGAGEAHQMPEPFQSTMQIWFLKFSTDTFGVRVHKICLRREGEHYFRRRTFCDPVDLSVLAEGKNGRLQVAIVWVLFRKEA